LVVDDDDVIEAAVCNAALNGSEEDAATELSRRD